MSAGVLTGAYRCKKHDRSFTYDAHWEERDATVVWTARVSHHQRLVEARSEIAAVDREDVGGTVKRAVEDWIERFSCTNGPPWPVAGAQSNG